MLNLDIGKELSGGHIVHGRVGDNKSYTEKISVINEDGSPFDLTGLTITFMGNTHNFQTKVIDSDGAALNDAKKGLFQYTFPSEAFGVAGPYERAYFQFTNKNGVVATTGDFEVIVLDNADLNASEAETVISEFNKLIEELQKLQEENIADLKQQQDDYVVELSQAFAGIQTDLITLEGKINSYEASINETATEVQGTISGAVSEALDTVSQALDAFQNGNFWTKEESFNKEESSANVIYQLVGKEKVRMTFTADFSNKESGSDDKNPHWASAVHGLNELPSPSDFKTELVQLRYDSLKILDGQKTTVNTVAGTANQYPCLEHKWDIVEIIKRELSEDFFVDRGAIDKASQATVAKKIIVSPLESSAWGFGTCPSGNSLKIANHINGVGWQTDQLPPNTTNLVKQITARNTATPSIDDEGFLRTIIYTEASSKTVQSQINVDYGNLVFSIEISMNEHIKSMMAANQVESIATGEEAEAGESNSVFMTPNLVFKAIAKWVQGKFVSTAGNETILGTKNFQDGIQVKGKLPVLTKSVNDYASVDKNNNASVISDGNMKLYRRGDIVYLTGSFKLSAAKYNQAVWFNVPSWAAPIDRPRMYWSSGSNFYLLAFDPSTINNIICIDNVAQDTWLTGSFCWLARDPY